MYNYMILHASTESPPPDFMSYYKRSESDELYFVSINHPKLLKHLEEYIDRSIN